MPVCLETVKKKNTGKVHLSKEILSLSRQLLPQGSNAECSSMEGIHDPSSIHHAGVVHKLSASSSLDVPPTIGC